MIAPPETPPGRMMNLSLPARITGKGGSPSDDGARAGIGEKLDQRRVRDLSVKDDDRLDALFERVDAGLDLRDHAAGDGAVRDQLSRVLDRELRDQLLGLVEHARHV